MTLENIQQAINSLNLDVPQLSLSVGNTPIQLNKDADPTIDNEYLILATSLEKPLEISALNTISGFVPDENIDFTNLNWLPPQLPLLEGLGFSKLELLVSKETRKLEGIDVVVSLANHWSLIPNVFTFDELNIGFLSFYLTDPQERYTECQIFGKIVLGNGGVHLDAKLDSLYSLTASLSSGSEIDLGSLLAHLLPGADAPKLKVEELTINLDFDSKTYDVTATVFEFWEIVSFGNNKLELEETIIYLSYTGGEQNSTTGEINALFKIAGCDITLRASHLVPGEGWQFAGSTGTGQAIPIGTLIEEIAAKFGVDQNLPTAIQSLTLENIGVSFNTKTKDFTFTCESKLEVESKQVDITVNINLTHKQDDSYHKEFDGHITVGTLKFDLIFSKDKDATSSQDGATTSTTFLAAYHNVNGDTIKVKDLIKNISDDVANPIPDSLSITLKDALFAYHSQTQPNKTKTSQFLFGLDIDGGIDISQLPIIGKTFPPNQTIKLTCQILIVSEKIEQQQVATFNALIIEGVTKLPDKLLEKGLDLAASIQLGSITQELNLPIQVNQSNNQGNSSPLAINPSQSPPTPKWFKLQKSFGPVHFERIGFQYKDNRICFLLDASLSAAGLTLSLDGLSVESPLTEFNAEFHLHGIGIDYQGGGAVEIGGAFLKTTQQTPDGQSYDEYDGMAVIKAEALTLAAIGSYAYLNGQPSLFVYAVLKYPIGGPPFFFVTGLAAGFGYNRSLKVPPIDQIAQFPLVEEVISGKGNPNNLTAELEKLNQYISPETGEIFLAIGIKFTSFKIIDSFALLTIAFGTRFELNVLGLANLIVPPPEAGKKVVSPVAEVQMVLKASFIPDEGFLGVQAQLTSASYILSKNCHLTGGFAFFCWFSGTHAGDFVTTLGGYHPSFIVPDHYPKVPRLGFNWQVDSSIILKGDAYFALCSHALMAGGHLEAAYKSGFIKAWFKAGADFLIAWKPYYYDAEIYVDIGASVGILTIDVGANLHIWGPEFGGKAEVHLWIISFTISFGSDSSPQPSPIDWNTFKQSFLPPNLQNKDQSDICTISVKDGLIKKAENSDAWIINPKNFSLITDSVIPSKIPLKKVQTEELPIEMNGAKPNTNFGIASMGVQPEKLITKHTITITREGEPVKKEDFKYIPILKNVPASLWGKSLKPDLNGEKFVEDVLSGFEIIPGTPPNAGETQAIDSSNLQYSTDSLPNAYDWENIEPFQADSGKKKKYINSNIIETSTVSARNNLLQALGFSIDSNLIDLSDSTADTFLKPPQVEKVTV